METFSELISKFPDFRSDAKSGDSYIRDIGLDLLSPFSQFSRRDKAKSRSIDSTMLILSIITVSIGEKENWKVLKGIMDSKSQVNH